MKLYHGTTVDIEQIDLSKSRPNKDFGRAFYLSTEEAQAMEMAQFNLTAFLMLRLWPSALRFCRKLILCPLQRRSLIRLLISCRT